MYPDGRRGRRLQGLVTLRGLVEQPLQIDASEAAVRRLTGLVGLRNELQLRWNAV
jgi:hypothetical protein